MTGPTHPPAGPSTPPPPPGPRVVPLDPDSPAGRECAERLSAVLAEIRVAIAAREYAGRTA